MSEALHSVIYVETEAEASDEALKTRLLEVTGAQTMIEIEGNVPAFLLYIDEIEKDVLELITPTLLAIEGVNLVRPYLEKAPEDSGKKSDLSEKLSYSSLKVSVPRDYADRLRQRALKVEEDILRHPDDYRGITSMKISEKIVNPTGERDEIVDFYLDFYGDYQRWVLERVWGSEFANLPDFAMDYEVVETRPVKE